MWQLRQSKQTHSSSPWKASSFLTSRSWLVLAYCHASTCSRWLLFTLQYKGRQRGSTSPIQYSGSRVPRVLYCAIAITQSRFVGAGCAVYVWSVERTENVLHAYIYRTFDHRRTVLALLLLSFFLPCTVSWLLCLWLSRIKTSINHVLNNITYYRTFLTSFARLHVKKHTCIISNTIVYAILCTILAVRVILENLAGLIWNLS